jgi:hypothetical protein
VTRQAPPRLAEAVSGEEGPGPNPTTGRFVLLAPFVRGMRARLSIFDVRGRRVAVVEGLSQSHLVWDGKDLAGSLVGPGIYLYRLEVGKVRQQGRIVVVR